MAAIFKSSLQNLSPLPTSLKVEPLAKPKTSLKFFVNTTKPKTKVLVVSGQNLRQLETKSLNFKPKQWLRPFMNMGPVSPLVTLACGTSFLARERDVMASFRLAHVQFRHILEGSLNLKKYDKILLFEDILYEYF